MKTTRILSMALLAALLVSGSAMAGESSTTWGNGDTTSTSTSIVNNGDGTATRTRIFTGEQGNEYTRTATRGDGTVSVTHANGNTRTTTHSR